jgi:hypothetical protein
MCESQLASKEVGNALLVQLVAQSLAQQITAILRQFVCLLHLRQPFEQISVNH